MAIGTTTVRRGTTTLGLYNHIVGVREPHRWGYTTTTFGLGNHNVPVGGPHRWGWGTTSLGLGNLKGGGSERTPLGELLSGSTDAKVPAAQRFIKRTVETHCMRLP